MGSGKNQLADDEILARAAAAEKGAKHLWRASMRWNSSMTLAEQFHLVRSP